MACEASTGAVDAALGKDEAAKGCALAAALGEGVTPIGAGALAGSKSVVRDRDRAPAIGNLTAGTGTEASTGAAATALGASRFSPLSSIRSAVSGLAWAWASAWA